MNKKFIIKKNEEIQQIIYKNNKKINIYFILYYVKNNLSYNRYCVSVSKKIANSVNRNKAKRVIKDLLMKNYFNNGFNCVIIIRKSCLDAKYETIQNNLRDLIGECK